LTLIRLVLLKNLAFAAKLRALYKSALMSTSLYNIPILLRNCLIYIASFIAFAIALYSAYIIAIATIFCFIKAYANTPLKIVKYIPVINLQSTILLI
jgi:hypothetical protein